MAWFVGYLALYAHEKIHFKSAFKFLPWSDLEIEFSKHL